MIIGCNQVGSAEFASRYQGAFIGVLAPVGDKVSGSTNLGGTAGVILDSRPMVWDESFLISLCRTVWIYDIDADWRNDDGIISTHRCLFERV